MFNGAIVGAQVKKYGVEATERYCAMRAYEFELISQSLLKDSDEAQQALYERDWWEMAREGLRVDINKKIEKSS